MAANRRLAQEFSYCLRNNRFIGREGGYFCLLEWLQPIIYPTLNIVAVQPIKAIIVKISTRITFFNRNFLLFSQQNFYIIEGSQSLRWRANRLPLWQHICFIILTENYKPVKIANRLSPECSGKSLFFYVCLFYIKLFNCFGAACAQGRVFCVLANGIAVNPAAFAFMAFGSFNGNFQIFAGCCLACITNAFMQFCLRYD